MLKTIDDDNRENVVDSSSDDNNSSGPIVKLDLSLNNGKKTTLCIYEEDNINKKVNEFCKIHKISPTDEKILLERVKEELETNSQNDNTIKNNNSLTNTIKESNNNKNISPKNMDYTPKQKNKLDHIIDESESHSLTESLKDSNNNLENLIKEYKNDNIDKFYNDTESSVDHDDSSKRSTKNNLKNNNNLNTNNNNINKNINKNINNSIINNDINKNINNSLTNKNVIKGIPIIFNNNSLLNQSKNNYVNSYNNLTNGTKINNTVIAPNPNYKISSNTQPLIYYQVQSPVISNYNQNSNNTSNLIYTTNSLYNTNNLKNYTNSSNISSLTSTSNLNYIENKDINKYGSQVYTPKNNQILYNNPTYKLTNTYQNINNQQNSLINLGLTNNNKPKKSNYINSNSNKKQSQPSMFNNLVNQKIEFIDYKTNNNNYNNKVNPIVQPVKYKVVQTEDNNIINNINKEKESIIYGYQPNKIISQYNNNIKNKGESIIYNVDPNKVNTNDSIVYNFNLNDIYNSKYTSLNNTNKKIEYVTLGKKVNNQKNDILTDVNNNINNNAYNNYNNINNKENNNYIINNQTKQTTINYDNVLNVELKDYHNNLNEQTYNNNNDTINNQLTEYIKDSVNSHILEFNKNESISNPIIDYKEQNSQFTIYENLPQNVENNNINNQKIEYSIQNNLNDQNNQYSIQGDLNNQNKEYTIQNNLNEPKNDYIIYDTAAIDNNTLQSKLTNEYVNYDTYINNNNNNNLQTQYTSQYTNQIENNTNLNNNNNNIEKTNSFINNKDQNEDTKSMNLNNSKSTENNNINMNNNSNNKYISNVAYNIQENGKNNSINNNVEKENNINQTSIDPQINTNKNEQLEPSTISKIRSYSFKNNKLITKKIESNYQSPKKIEQEGAKEKNNNVIRTDPMDSQKGKQKEFNNDNKNDSLYNSEEIKEDKSEIKNAEKKKSINEKIETEIINNNDNNGRDLIEEKEPQDNSKKKRKLDSELPQDSDEIHYKESQIQYDNISSISNKNKVSNESNNNAIIPNEISYHENSSTKNNPEKNIGKINNTKNNNNISNYNSYNSIINEEELNNSLNYSNTKNKNSDIKDLLDMSSNINKKEVNISKSSINDNINNFSNNESENNDSNILGYEKMNNYLDKELEMNKPKYKKKDNLESNSKINSNKNISSYNYNNKNKTNNKINKKKIEINQQKINPKKKPMKVLTFKKNEFITNNINRRSNSSGNNKTKFGGVRLYEQYMNKLNKKSEMNKRLLNEGLEEENKEIYFMPNIDPNSRRIVERLRSIEENKVEDRLINYGFNKKQKHLIQHANNDVINKTKSPFRPKIDSNSRVIANKNKKIRINETIKIMEEKKRKRNRSIGNEHRNKNSFINFEEAKNSNNMNIINIKNNINNNNNYYMVKNKNQFKKPNNNENNYNINTYRNSKNDNNTISDENRTTMSQLNKTIDLNNAYRELYNSIDEKNDSEITKFFGNCITESIVTDNNNIINTQIKTKSNISDIKNKYILNEDRRALTPQTYKNNYNTFDYLFYESEKIREKKKKKQELNFRRNHPFKPRISPHAKQLKNKETTKEFINRISKNLEEIKIINSSNRPRGNRKSKYILIEQNSKNDFRPKITRGPKSPKQRDINVNLEGYYDKRITQERKDLQRLKTEEEKERKNVYNQKSKDIIMKMKYKKYRELFNLLDSNQDGFISSTKIRLTKIDENVLRNISPILEELNQSKKQMDFKEFCIKIDKLMTEKKLEQNK